MKQYWPNATRLCITPTGSTEHLSTYDAADTMQTALKQFEIWRDQYKFKLLRCWIDVYEDGQKIDSIDEADLTAATRPQSHL